jgi:hypothetical protein
MKKCVKPTTRGRKAEQALQRAVARVVEENRRLGLPIAVMKGGRAVLIPVEEALRDSKKCGKESKPHKNSTKRKIS